MLALKSFFPPIFPGIPITGGFIYLGKKFLIICMGCISATLQSFRNLFKWGWWGIGGKARSIIVVLQLLIIFLALLACWIDDWKWILLSVISSCLLCSWTSSSVHSLTVYSFIPSLLVLCLPNDNTNGVELVKISVLQCIAQLLKNSVDSKKYFFSKENLELMVLLPSG